MSSKLQLVKHDNKATSCFRNRLHAILSLVFYSRPSVELILSECFNITSLLSIQLTISVTGKHLTHRTSHVVIEIYRYTVSVIY